MGAVFVILLITIAGGMLFALTSGFFATEQERAGAGRPGVGNDVSAEAGGERCPACGASQRRLGVDALLVRLEQRIRDETAAVSRFTDAPSVASLHAAYAAAHAGQSQPSNAAPVGHRSLAEHN